ncbi:MAG: hypothetical protein KDC61_07660 [Saprospiraceae bacterium]|nr:hypothetical protein [Saprospiraceae bacterium]MCB0544023.1 hypothetical protein [Saprospiraceae bacterium]MCB0574426.1 hypothetical protein [Saprospiraceae bacterium]
MAVAAVAALEEVRQFHLVLQPEEQGKQQEAVEWVVVVVVVMTIQPVQVAVRATQVPQLGIQMQQHPLTLEVINKILQVLPEEEQIMDQ